MDSVNNEVEPINQATNFLYYTTTGHPFLNGNKRTAFEVSKGILMSGATLLKVSQNDIIEFITGSLAQGKASKEDVKKWLTSNSKPVNQNPEFNEITSENIEKDKEMLKKMD